jgi:hypothetical protein
LGHTTGLPHDPDGQRALLTEGLTAAAAGAEPGAIVDLPYRFVDDAWKADPLGWSRQRQQAGTTAQPAGDTRQPRSAEPQYQTPADKEAADQT